jgi:protease secretion system outer membrane protein
MMRPIAAVLVAAALGATGATAQAGVFQQAYAGALANDPTYRAARQALASSVQGVPIAQAALRPNLSLSVSDARVTGSRTADNFLGQSVTQPLDYRAPQQTLALRAPFLNLDATHRVRQAQVQLAIAETVLLARRHELLDRVGQAYLQRLFALQNQHVAQNQMLDAAEQRQLALRRFELGDGTRPEVRAAEAGLALAQAQAREADDQLASANLILAQITGLAALPAEPLGDDFVAPRPSPAGLAGWLEQAAATNPDIIARRSAVDLARVGVERAESGHYPRIDLVASISKGRNESVSTLNQALSQRSVGVQLNLPLYGGGIVDASVTQALAEQEKAQAELEAEQLSVNADVSRLYRAVETGAVRQQAQQQVLDASRLALEGARRNVAGGVGIRADIARAQAKVTEAVRDLAKLRYEQLLALLRLHSRAGTTPEEIVRLIDEAMSAPTRTANR